MNGFVPGRYLPECEAEWKEVEYKQKVSEDKAVCCEMPLPFHIILKDTSCFDYKLADPAFVVHLFVPIQFILAD